MTDEALARQRSVRGFDGLPVPGGTAHQGHEVLSDHEAARLCPAKIATGVGRKVACHRGRRCMFSKADRDARVIRFGETVAAAFVTTVSQGPPLSVRPCSPRSSQPRVVEWPLWQRRSPRVPIGRSRPWRSDRSKMSPGARTGLPSHRPGRQLPWAGRRVGRGGWH